MTAILRLKGSKAFQACRTVEAHALNGWEIVIARVGNGLETCGELLAAWQFSKQLF